MKFQSTRDESAAKFSAAQVIKQGLAADGGLFVPEEIPALTADEIQALCKVDYTKSIIIASALKCNCVDCKEIKVL